jgi:hypothetical protein
MEELAVLSMFRIVYAEIKSERSCDVRMDLSRFPPRASAATFSRAVPQICFPLTEVTSYGEKDDSSEEVRV